MVLHRPIECTALTGHVGTGPVRVRAAVVQFPTMRAPTRRPKNPRPELSVEQQEMAAQFSDFAFDYPTLSFDEVAKKVLGPNPFAATPTGRKFRTEAKAAFDQERSG